MSWIVACGSVVVKDSPVNRQIFRMIRVLTLPRGNAKLPPQASPAHSGTCQHGLCCHTQVVHQFGCACMEAPKTKPSGQCSHIISFCSHPSPATSASLGFSTSLVNILADLLVAFFFFAVPTPIAVPWKWNQGKHVWRCWKEGPIRALLDKMRTLVWFFTASAAALIFSSNSQGNILGTQPLWHLKARVRIAVPSRFTMFRFLLIPLSMHIVWGSGGKRTWESTKSIKSTSCAVLSSPSETKTLNFHLSIICHLLTYPHPPTNTISSIAVQVAASPR